MALPFLVDLGRSHPLALWFAVSAGAAALLLTIFTDHETGLFRVVPYAWHLAVDFTVGISFVALPVLLGFRGLEAWYYWLNGAAVIAVVSLHRPANATAAA
jgi:hypothetical protein